MTPRDELKLAALALASVEREPYIEYSGTIGMARVEAALDRVVAAARKVLAEEFVKAHDEGRACAEAERWNCAPGFVCKICGNGGG